jgi:NAD(P)-dependent dehydrogenase (short-subunit alcohol dehydrogenase family)
MKIENAVVSQSGVQALRLDVTNPEHVAAAAAQASDVNLIINNAGIAQPGGFLAADSEETARRIFETNFFAMLRVDKLTVQVKQGMTAARPSYLPPAA